MNTFEVGRTYTLKVGSVYDFSFTDDIRSKVGIMPGQYSTFTFTPTRVYLMVMHLLILFVLQVHVNLVCLI